jgi:predicted AlkP superfamily phosphohydrolase/phosphomutase
MKMVVIGLDGVCLDILRPWIDRQELPHLKNLLCSGVYADLESTVPPYTAPAWTSMITGKNPGKHGVFDFSKRRGEFQTRLVSSLDNKAKTVWEHLSERGKKAIVINVPITHPARRIDGVVIPGLLAPSTPSCHPPHILEEVEQALGEYKVYSTYETQKVSAAKKLQGYVDVTKLRKDTAVYLGKKYDWDFLMVEFQKTDSVFHNFTDEKHILPFYRFIDQCIGELVGAHGTNANVFLVSDHGIGRHRYTFFVNSWLRREGWLKCKGIEKQQNTVRLQRKRIMDSGQAPHTQHRVLDRLTGLLARTGLSAERGSSWLSSLHLDFLKPMFPDAVVAGMPRMTVDERHSAAYCLSPLLLGIEINRSIGRDYRWLRKRLIEGLRDVRDPEGNLVFEAVLPREECYHGPYVEAAPDVVFVPRDMDYTISERVYDKLFSPCTVWNHKMRGIFAATGDCIATNGCLGNTLSIFDVAPTILHMFGLPVPADMDGRVLNEIFREGSEPQQRDVEHQDVNVEGEWVRERIRRLRESGKL